MSFMERSRSAPTDFDRTQLTEPFASCPSPSRRWFVLGYSVAHKLSTDFVVFASVCAIFADLLKAGATWLCSKVQVQETPFSCRRAYLNTTRTQPGQKMIIRRSSCWMVDGLTYRLLRCFREGKSFTCHLIRYAKMRRAGR